MSERWKSVPGFEGAYKVSTYGRVKSLDRVVGGRHGNRKIEGRIIRPCKNPSGHLIIRLYQNSKLRKFYVHELVLITFVGPRPKGMECRHFPDPNPENNRLDNLSWGSHSQNFEDRRVFGFSLDWKDVKFIREHENAKLKDLAEMFGVTRQTIWHVRHNKTWKVA